MNRVVPAGQEVEAALEMARLCARRAPLSLWFAKSAVNVGLTMPLEAALAFEIGLTAQLFTTEDRAEGLRAFQEKRDAEFRAGDRGAMSMDLDGHAAIVTGGGQGIGRGIALALAAEGADVAVFDVNRTSARRWRPSDPRAGPPRARPRGGRHRSRARRSAATAEVASTLGRLDVLVNNAGWTPNEPFAESAPETWQRIVAVNYMGVLNCTRAALAAMMPRGRGRIVSIASDAARVGTPREAVYAGAKAAVIGFSKSLAAEVARHAITVNVVSPATVDTPLLRGMLTPEQIERREKANPMGRPRPTGGRRGRRRLLRLSRRRLRHRPDPQRQRRLRPRRIAGETGQPPMHGAWGCPGAAHGGSDSARSCGPHRCFWPPSRPAAGRPSPLSSG